MSVQARSMLDQDLAVRDAGTALLAQAAKDLIDDPELRQLGVEVRDDAAVYALEICRLAV